MSEHAASENDASASPDRTALVQTAAHSLKWSVFIQLAPRVISPLTTALLAALLTPDDFGVVAAAGVIMVLAQIVVGAGLGAAVVQRRADLDAASATAFWINAALATLVYGVVFLLAPGLADAYRNPAMLDVIRVSALAIVLYGLNSVPTALLQRDMRFRGLFWVTALPQILGSVISAIWALLGGGVWALVFGPLAGTLLNTYATWRLIAWRPAFRIQPVIARQILRFGFWVVLANFQMWLFLYADNAIAGFLLGTNALGVYSLGFNLANLLPGMIASSLAAVIFPALSRIQDDVTAVGSAFNAIVQRAGAAIFPICFGTAAIATPVIALLYGDKWEGLGPVLSALAIAPGMMHLWAMCGEAFRAAGQPAAWTQVAALNLAILLPLLWWAGGYDVYVYTLARVIGALPLPLLAAWMTARVLHVPVRAQIEALSRTLLAAVLMYGAVSVLVAAMQPYTGIGGMLKLIAAALCGVGVYGGLLRVLSPTLFGALWDSARRLIGR